MNNLIADVCLGQWIDFLTSSPYSSNLIRCWHYSEVILSAMASQITSASIVYSTVCSGTNQRKHQSSASLGFLRGIRRWPVISPHKGPVTRKMFPFDDVTWCICFSDLTWFYGVSYHLRLEYLFIGLLTLTWKKAPNLRIIGLFSNTRPWVLHKNG